MPAFRSHRSPYFEARALAMSGSLQIRWNDWLSEAPPEIPDDIDLANKVEGMLLGLAIGDALGNTSESMMPAARSAAYGRINGYLPNKYAEGRRVGIPLDDTQMAFWTIEHLVSEGQVEPQYLVEFLSLKADISVHV